jgi:hypothetical protein
MRQDARQWQPIAALREALRRYAEIGYWFWSGAWHFHFDRWLTLRRLARSLDRDGEDSSTVSALTMDFRLLERACKYWGHTDPLVYRTLEAARAALVPEADLRILAFNGDIQQVGGTIVIRAPKWARALGIAATVVVLATWLLLSAYTLLHPAPLLPKLGIVLVLTPIYGALWHGFALYSIRAATAVNRSGEAVLESYRAMASRRGEVIAFPRKLGQ